MDFPNKLLASILAKPCSKSRLLLAKIGGTLEGVRETGFTSLNSVSKNVG
jgi:hypothetical protein